MTLGKLITMLACVSALFFVGGSLELVGGCQVFEIDKRVDPGLEITRRISLAMPVLKRLELFGNKRMYQRNLPVGLRLQTFIQPRSATTY